MSKYLDSRTKTLAYNSRDKVKSKKEEKMSIEVSNLDHLGLVAGIIDEIGIEQKINQLLGEELSEKITGGQAVKGMLLNGLGLVSSPLYLFSKFFEGKAIEHLIGKGVKTEYFNDDKLGRVLDQLYHRGFNQIFMSVVLEAVKIYQLETNTVYLDSTSFHVHGDYQTDDDELTEDIEPKTIKITYVGLWTKRKIVSVIFTLTNLEKYFSVSSEFNH